MVQVQIYTKTFSFPNSVVDSPKTFMECKAEAIHMLKEYPGLMCISIYEELAVKSRRITLYRNSENDGYFGIDPILRKELDKCLLT